MTYEQLHDLMVLLHHRDLSYIVHANGWTHEYEVVVVAGDNIPAIMEEVALILGWGVTCDARHGWRFAPKSTTVPVASNEQIDSRPTVHPPPNAPLSAPHEGDRS